MPTETEKVYLRAARKPRRSITPQAPHTSTEKNDYQNQYGDDAGNTIVARIGAQFDGTYVAASLGGPTPPAPSTPVLIQGVSGLVVNWDGIFLGADGQPDIMVTPPLDFSRVEVHASTDPNLTGELAETLAGTIETPRGANVPVELPLGVHYVRLVVRTLSGKASTPSAVVSAEVVPIDGTRIAADAIDGKIITGGVFVAPGDVATMRIGAEESKGNPGILFRPNGSTYGATIWSSDGNNLWLEPSRASIEQPGTRIILSQWGGEVVGDDWTFGTRTAFNDNLVVNAGVGGDESFAVFSDVNYPDGMVRSGPTYENVTTVSSNLNVSSGGFLRRSTSLEAAKINIDWQWGSGDSWRAVKALKPVTYYDRGNTERYAELTGGEEVMDAAYPVELLGFIAEQVHEHMPTLNTYGEYGDVSGVAYDRVAAAHQPWLLEHDTKLLAAERRIKTLEDAVADLTRRLDEAGL